MTQQQQEQEEQRQVVFGLLLDAKQLTLEQDTQQQYGATSKSALLLEQIKKDTKPDYIMGLLAPNLFMERNINASTDRLLDVSSKEALSILLWLATSAPNVYLKPASRAIRMFLEKSNDKQDDAVYISDELLHLIVAQLSGMDVEVSTNATMALVAACQKLGPSLASHALPIMGEAWKAAWEKRKADKQTATTICVRCVHAVVRVVCLSNSIMREATITTSLLNDCLVSAMLVDSADDPLLQMSTLDLLETLAKSKPMHESRAQWLQSAPVVQPLLDMAGGEEGDGPDPILGGPALCLLSTILNNAGVISNTTSNTHFLTSFHHALRNFTGKNGELDRLAMIDAISNFAASDRAALEIALQDSVLKEAWLSLAVAQPKLKAVVLLSVARVLNPESQEDDDAIMTDAESGATRMDNALAMKLFAALARCNNSHNTTELLLSMARSPLIELRLGAYAVILAVAKLGTGAQVLLTSSGFYDFLISRDGKVETTTEGRKEKYSIVVAVLQSDAKGLLADKIVKALEDYVKQGPHYIKTQSWELATE